MKKNIKDYLAPMAQEMIKNDKSRNDLLNKIDDMVECRWSLPDEIKDVKEMREIVSTDPQSVIITGGRTLATIEAQVFLQPLNSNIVTKNVANWHEMNLLWQLRRANERARRDIVGDIIESALRYDAIATFTVPVKWQLKGTGRAGDTDGFMVLVENYKDVHPRFSPLGLESVLHVKVMTAQEAVQFWGDKVKKLANKIKGEEKELYVCAFEWWGEDHRATWLSEAVDHPTAVEATSVEYIVHNEDPKLPFNPWSIEEGGSSLGTSAAYQIRPLLAPIAHTNAWETQNLALTLAFSEAIAYSAAPRGIVTSYAPDSVTIDYGEFHQPVRLMPTDKYEKLDPPAIDQNLLHIYDRENARIDKLTGIKNLANLDPPSGTAFATVNAVIKAATSALDPAKKLAEAGLGGIFKKMILWTAHTKDPMVGFGYHDYDMGREYTLEPEHIEPDHVYVVGKLTTHIPTDRIQRINAASMLNKELEFSLEDAYREMDIANPEEIMARWEQEQLDRAMLQAEVMKIEADAQLEIEAKQMELQMQMQQQVQQQQMQAQQQAQMQEARKAQLLGEQDKTATRTGEPRKLAQSQAVLGKRGFDTQRGGESPNVASPEGFTRESQTGIDKEGEVIG